MILKINHNSPSSSGTQSTPGVSLPAPVVSWYLNWESNCKRIRRQLERRTIGWAGLHQQSVLVSPEDDGTDFVGCGSVAFPGRVQNACQLRCRVKLNDMFDSISRRRSACERISICVLIIAGKVTWIYENKSIMDWEFAHLILCQLLCQCRAIGRDWGQVYGFWASGQGWNETVIGSGLVRKDICCFWSGRFMPVVALELMWRDVC